MSVTIVILASGWNSRILWANWLVNDFLWRIPTFAAIKRITASGSTGDYYAKSSTTYSSVSPTSATLNSVNVSSQAFYNDAGVTVPGSKSDQSFSTTYMGAMDPTTHTIVLKLLGETPDNKPVIKPVIIVERAAQRNQNKAVGAIIFPIAGFCSSGILGILGICTKLKYQSNPIHIIPDKTCKYLNIALQK